MFVLHVDTCKARGMFALRCRVVKNTMEPPQVEFPTQIL